MSGRTIPINQISGLDRAKPHRRLDPLEQHRDQRLAEPARLLGFFGHPWALHRILGPEYDHAACILESFLQYGTPAASGRDAPIPPHAPACGFERARKLRRRFAVFVGVAYENIRHRVTL